MSTLNDVLDQIPVILRQRYNIQKFWVQTANKILGEIEPFMEFQERKVIGNVKLFEHIIKYDIPDTIRKVAYVAPSLINIDDSLRYNLFGDKIVLDEKQSINEDFQDTSGTIEDIGPDRTYIESLDISPTPEDNQLVGMVVRIDNPTTGLYTDYYVSANNQDSGAVRIYLESQLENDINLTNEFNMVPDYIRVEGFAKIDRFDSTIPDGETDPVALSQDIPLKEEWERVVVNGLRYYGETQMQATSGEAQRWQSIYYESIEDLKADNWRNRGFEREQIASDWPTIG